MDPKVPDTWCQAIAEELHRIAYDLGNVVTAKGDLPEPGYIHLHIQPSGTEDEQIAAIDDLGTAVTGEPGHPYEMHDGKYHYRADGHRGPVMVRFYTSIETERAERMLAERAEADKDAELERLRARVAELEARPAPIRPADPDADGQAFLDALHASVEQVRKANTIPTGLDAAKFAGGWTSAAAQAYENEDGDLGDRLGIGYSRADGEPEGDVTQQLGHRIEPHVGAVTEQGLVDETPDPNTACAAHDDAHLGSPCPDRTIGIDPDASMEAHYDAEADYELAPASHPDWAKHVHGCGGGRQCRCVV